MDLIDPCMLLMFFRGDLVPFILSVCKADTNVYKTIFANIANCIFVLNDTVCRETRTIPKNLIPFIPQCCKVSKHKNLILTTLSKRLTIGCIEIVGRFCRRQLTKL